MDQKENSKKRDERKNLQMSDFRFKAPQDVVFDLPQERITGDVLRGYGPRRGNLERLLRYWRPIMRKPGGFRRCRVILADHPELYPLNNICAWLHHETTGLWPNEGGHHPGMKVGVGKLKKRNWSNDEFTSRLNRSISAPGKLARSVGSSRALGKTLEELNIKDEFFSDDTWRQKSDELNLLTAGDVAYASKVLLEFLDAEKDFISYINNNDNWEIQGLDSAGLPMVAPFIGTKCCE